MVYISFQQIQINITYIYMISKQIAKHILDIILKNHQTNLVYIMKILK
jgi:hypothetical protein